MKPIPFAMTLVVYLLLMMISGTIGNWLASIAWLCAALTMAEIDEK